MTVKNLLYLAAGAALGSTVTFFAVRKHFSDKAEHDIQEIRDYYAKKQLPEQEAEASVPDQPTLDHYTDIIASQNYATAEDAKIVVPETRNMTQIEVIDADEYGNREGYDAILSYTYYTNGVLTDENNDPLSQESITNMVGSDFYKKFVDDVLYIRNNEMKCDFEILLDETEYFPPTISG